MKVTTAGVLTATGTTLITGTTIQGFVAPVLNPKNAFKIYYDLKSAPQAAL